MPCFNKSPGTFLLKITYCLLKEKHKKLLLESSLFIIICNMSLPSTAVGLFIERKVVL